MALSDADLDAAWTKARSKNGPQWVPHFEALRAVEALVRKDYDALIRQMLEALESSHATLWEEDDDPSRPAHAAIAAARAHLIDSDLSKLTERGAKAWAGVDPQKLREGKAL